MAGSHRAATPPRRSRGPATVVAVVVVVAAAIGGAYALNRSKGDSDTSPNPPITTPTATPTPTSLPTVTLTPTPTPTPSPTKTSKPLPRVAASTPHRMVVRGLFDVGFDSAIAPRNGAFRAASTAEVARWGGRGVPGSPSTDTVYVIGKVSPQGAFAKLPKLHRGVKVSLQTATGVLTYTVQAVTERKAAGLTGDPTFSARVPGRLQLVGLRYDASGDRTGTILVVTAQLTGARRGR